MLPNVLDVYHGDNNDRPIDWTQIVKDGFDAVFHKISQGRNTHDPQFVTRITAAAQTALEIGGYHFLTNETDGKTQFAFAYGIVRSLPHFNAVYFQIAADYEKLPGKTPTPQILYDFLSAALDAGFSPWCYGSDLLRETISNDPAWREKFAELVKRGVKLWLAEYGPKESVPLPWTDPKQTIWQYSESGTEPGVSGHVDLNYCPGDITALWVNQKPSPILAQAVEMEKKPMGDTLAEIDTVLKDAEEYLPFVSPLLNAIPGASGYLALAQTILGAFDNAIGVVQSIEGKSPSDAITTVLQHLTPGQPNATSLAPPGGAEIGGPGSQNAGAGVQ